jgi:hypothetical protein
MKILCYFLNCNDSQNVSVTVKLIIMSIWFFFVIESLIEPVGVGLPDNERDVPAVHGGVQAGLVQLELDHVAQE